MTNQYNELDLVEDFVQVSERFIKDMESIFDKSHFKNFTVCVMPRSKRESKYKQSQLMFKKAISCCANKLGFINGTDAIIRVKDIIGDLKITRETIHTKASQKTLARLI